MKKLVIAAVLVVTAASTAFAFSDTPAGYTGGIRRTAHDIPGTWGGAATDQKCVFCHTPHNARVNVPLWNRNQIATISNVYNSPSLTSAGKAATVQADSISSFCMSCHDGTTAMGNIQNTAQPGASTGGLGSPYNVGINTHNTASKAGFTSLTNSHPVGFSYVDAYNEDVGALGGARLIAPAQVGVNMGMTGGKSPFFNKVGGGQTGDQMECASCHKVHDDTYAPFLRYSNGGSALCLACHNK